MSEWQPIETAPDAADGYSYSITFTAYSAEYSGAPFPCKRRGEKFYDLDGVDRDGDWWEVYPTPTHWMHLPNPPEHKSKDDE